MSGTLLCAMSGGGLKALLVLRQRRERGEERAVADQACRHRPHSQTGTKTRGAKCILGGLRDRETGTKTRGSKCTLGRS